MKHIDFYSYILGGLIMFLGVYNDKFVLFIDKIIDKIRGVLKRD